MTKYQIVSWKILKECNSEEEAIKSLEAIKTFNNEKIDKYIPEKKEILTKDGFTIKIKYINI